MCSHPIQLAFCTIESRWTHAFITPIKVSTHAADARGGVALVDIDMAVAPFEPFWTLAVVAIALVDTHAAI